MPNKIIITQSNYIPWKGYFTTMKKATHIVLYDNAQYTRRDWRNRNKIVTPTGPAWLSIPIDVKGKYHQKINEAKVKDREWYLEHWNKISQNYKKAPFFAQYSEIFEDLYLNKLKEHEYLSDINRILLQRCIDLLGINITVLDSRDFEIRGGKTGKLVNICQDLQADEYFTGPAAKGYMEEEMFEENNIKLTYYDLEGFPEYKQLWDGFDHYVSILDMFFNVGDSTKDYFNWEKNDK
tara:strand:+ start:72 stop:782 length:711 start_codon:yes stop_codon:yes gene_type:complete